MDTPNFDTLLFRVEVSAEGKRFRVGWDSAAGRVYTVGDLNDGGGDRLLSVTPMRGAKDDVIDAIYEDLDRALRSHAPSFVVPQRSLERIAALLPNRATAVTYRDLSAVDDVRARLARWFVAEQKGSRNPRLCAPRIMEALFVNANAANTRSAREIVSDALSDTGTLSQWETQALSAWCRDDYAQLALGLAGLSRNGCERCAVVSMEQRRVMLCDECAPPANDDGAADDGDPEVRSVERAREAAYLRSQGIRD